MRRVLPNLLLTALLTIGSAAGLSAQAVVQIPPALEEDDPRVPLVRGLSTLVTAGDPSAAEAYLLQHAASSLDRAQAMAQLRALFEELDGAFEVPALREGPGGEVLVPLWKKGGQGPSFILVVGTESGTPHRITGIQFGPPVLRG